MNDNAFNELKNRLKKFYHYTFFSSEIEAKGFSFNKFNEGWTLKMTESSVLPHIRPLGISVYSESQEENGLPYSLEVIERMENCSNGNKSDIGVFSLEIELDPKKICSQYTKNDHFIELINQFNDSSEFLHKHDKDLEEIYRKEYNKKIDMNELKRYSQDYRQLYLNNGYNIIKYYRNGDEFLILDLNIIKNILRVK
jgi:hypothetical protein